VQHQHDAENQGKRADGAEGGEVGSVDVGEDPVHRRAQVFRKGSVGGYGFAAGFSGHFLTAENGDGVVGQLFQVVVAAEPLDDGGADRQDRDEGEENGQGQGGGPQGQIVAMKFTQGDDDDTEKTTQTGYRP